MTGPTDDAWDLVVFSDDFGRRPSAPQHLGAHLAKGRKVLWVEPAGLRRPGMRGADLARALQKLRGAAPGPVPRSPHPWIEEPAGLTRLVPPVVPAYGLAPVRAANDAVMGRLVREAMAREGIERPVVLTSIPTMAGLVGHLGERAALYLRMDDYTLWPGYDHEAIAERERVLLDRIDALVAPSQALLDVGPGGPSVRRVVPHGVDAAHFATGGRDPMPGVPRPRLVVAGRLDDRLDWELLAGLLAATDHHLVLIGEAMTVPEAMRAHPRTHMVPAVPYADLPRWLHAADVLLVPYRASPLGHSLAPLKTRELLATGRPVVATPLAGTTGDEEITPLLSLAAGREATVTAVASALREAPSAGAARQAATRAMGWASRADALSDLVRGLLPFEPL